LTWRQHDLYRIVDGLLRDQKYETAIPVMQSYLTNFSEKRFAVQLALMKVWIARKQPSDALQLLDTIDIGSLSPAERQQLDKMRAIATKAQTSK